MKRILAVALAVATACGAPAARAPEPTASAGGENTQTARSTAPASRATSIPRGWSSYRSPEVGVSFIFPPIPGTTRYGFTRHERDSTVCGDGAGGDPSGLYFRWQAHVQDEGLPYSYWFAGGASRDASEGRGSWPTDIRSWGSADARTVVRFCRGSEDVEPLKIIERQDGSSAMVFAPKDMFLEEPSANDRGDRVAVVNFPREFSATVDAIVFYFIDPTPLADIERVIESVRFEET